MLEQNLGNNDEALKEAILLFNKQKDYILDHLLERTAVVPNNAISEIASKYQINEEIAKIIFVLDFEYNINQDLSSNYYKYEIERLKKVNFQLPNVYSFLIRFAIEEGFWIKYLTIDLPNKLKNKISKLMTIDRSLFGDLEGSKEDSALYMIEREFLMNEILKPMINVWIKEHQRSSYYDAAISIICSMNKKAIEKGEVIINELCNRLNCNLDSLKEIISELDKKAWAQKAIASFNDLQKNLDKSISDPTKMNWRIVAELILENRIIMEYENLALEKEIIVSEQAIKINKTETKTNKISETKQENLVDDKITTTLLNIDSQTQEDQEKIIHQLITDEFDKATKYKRQKPTVFAKEFLERILDELVLNSKTVKNVLRKFDSSIMFRLSPMGVKENPDKSVDDIVISSLEETIIENLSRKKVQLEKRTQEELPLKMLATEKIEKKVKQTKIANKKESSTNNLREVTDKELWVIIRDAYLRELFNSNEEKIAGARVLKRFSLELGLLLTENESINLITQELMKKGLTIIGSNKEDLDKNICKIILNQIKEQRQYQTKIISEKS